MPTHHPDSRITNRLRTSLLGLCWLLLGVLPAAACDGDCGGDGVVTVDELVLAVSIALGSARVEQCHAVDGNGDGSVTVDEILSAIQNTLTGCPSAEPRLLALSREGQVVSVDVTSPWSVRASQDLGATIASARCRGRRCLIVHPSIDAISIVDPIDLTLLDTLQLERGADPRDVALLAGDLAVISQHGKAELLLLNLQDRSTQSVDLGVFADDDGLPEMLRLASCGRRVFVQMLRIDHDTQAPAKLGAALAVVDLDRSAAERLVDADPNTAGVQPVLLAGKPNFDMPVDCEAGVLFVAEPALLMQGGGSYEQVDLATLEVNELPIDTGAEVGGFEFVAPGIFWIITHTTTGPAPSSHLNILGGTTPDTHNTFAPEHVNDLALDRVEDLLFYPDPCVPSPRNPGCEPGIHVFHAHTGEPAASGAIELGLAPIEVVLAR